MAVKKIPDGFHTVTAHLTIAGCSDAIEFYKKAFGAEEQARMPGPGGKIMHATLRIGDSMVMCNDAFPEWGSPGPDGKCSPVKIALYVEDADAMFKGATDAGAEVVMPMMDAPWGDRYGMVRDQWGHEWELCTHVEDLTPEQIGERMSKMGCG